MPFEWLARSTGNVIDMAKAMGISLLTEAQYRQVQEVGEFDIRISSWVATPPEVRKLGGALFFDRRYDSVFVYHNGPQSYYAAHGFRGAPSGRRDFRFGAAARGSPPATVGHQRTFPDEHHVYRTSPAHPEGDE